MTTDNEAKHILVPYRSGHGWQWSYEMRAHVCRYCGDIWTPFSEDGLFSCEFLEKVRAEHRARVAKELSPRDEEGEDK